MTATSTSTTEVWKPTATKPFCLYSDTYCAISFICELLPGIALFMTDLASYLGQLSIYDYIKHARAETNTSSK